MLIRVLIFMVPMLFLVWLQWSPSNKPKRTPQQGYEYETYAKPNEAKIREVLLDVLQAPDRACVLTPRLPYDTSVSSEKCDRCDALVDAGLLGRSIENVTKDDQPFVAVRYELTAAGRPLYTETLRDYRREGLAGLCFGQTVIGDLELWVQGSQTYTVVDVRYVPKIENPHELLRSTHAQALGLPQLEPGKDLLSLEVLCASIDSSGAFTSGTLDGTQVTVNGVPRCRM